MTTFSTYIQAGWKAELRQRLGGYEVEPLPGRHWLTGISACSLWIGPGVDPGRVFLYLFVPSSLYSGTHECKPHWLSEPGDPGAYLSQAAATKAGMQKRAPTPSRGTLVT